MLIVKLKKGEDINRALKRFKQKFRRTGVLNELRSRKEFVKPSIKRRNQIQKAKYIQKIRTEEQK
tara:strand:- start:228 stop:422 length:195 start_codon:yes stop_codon:yes gene_type:complete